MVFGNKNIDQLGANVDSLRSKIDKLCSSLSETKDSHEKTSLSNEKAIGELTERIGSLEAKKESRIADLDAEIKRFTDLNKKLEKRVNAFEVLEKKATRKIFDEVTHEVKSQIRSLLTTTKRYTELEKGLSKTSNDVLELNENIEKLKSISKSIKEADFNLNKHRINMEKSEAEKLRLLRENERLKQLIAKERRRSSR